MLSRNELEISLRGLAGKLSRKGRDNRLRQKRRSRLRGKWAAPSGDQQERCGRCDHLRSHILFTRVPVSEAQARLNAAYHVAALEHIALRKRPLLCGALYGAAWFVLVHVVAVPLFSAAPPKRLLLDWNLACLLAHMLLVGIPTALMARRWYEAPR